MNTGRIRGRCAVTSVVVWIVACVALVGCCANRHDDRLTFAAPAPAQAMVIGVGEDYPVDSWSAKNIDRDLDHLRQLNVRVLRLGLAWDHIEPAPGEFDWHFVDELVAAAQSHGVELLPYICYTPRWESKSPDSYWRQPPRDLSTFATFAHAIVCRYRGKIHSWEIWNEPDNQDYWTGSAAEYAKLVEAGSTAVRSADPSEKVVLGGISWNTDFLRRLFRDEHIGKWIDIINVHNYDETWIGDPLESIVPSIEKVKDIITEYGQGQAIWAAEIGYSDYRAARYVSADYEARFNYEHTASYQADDLFRALTLLRSTDLVQLATWYRLNDLPATQDVIGDVNNRHLGLIKTTGEEKPAFQSLQLFARLLGGKVRVFDNSCHVTRRARSDAEVHCFRRDDGELIAVAWLHSDTPGYRPVDGIDPRVEQVLLTLPFAVQSAQECDLENMAWHPLPIDESEHQTVISLVNIKGGETRIILIKPHTAGVR